MTSVHPACPSECGAFQSRQSVWLAVTLYILTASLWKLKVFACLCLSVCVYVYSVHGCCDGRWHVSGCGRAHVICLAERWAVNGWSPDSDMCNIVTSELVCCPIWPVERSNHKRAGESWMLSFMFCLLRFLFMPLSSYFLTFPPSPGLPVVPPFFPSFFCSMFRGVKAVPRGWLFHPYPTCEREIMSKRVSLCVSLSSASSPRLLRSLRSVIFYIPGFFAANKGHWFILTACSPSFSPSPSLFLLSKLSQTYQQSSSLQSKNRKKNKGKRWKPPVRFPCFATLWAGIAPYSTILTSFSHSLIHSLANGHCAKMWEQLLL